MALDHTIGDREDGDDNLPEIGVRVGRIVYQDGSSIYVGDRQCDWVRLSGGIGGPAIIKYKADGAELWFLDLTDEPREPWLYLSGDEFLAIAARSPDGAGLMQESLQGAVSFRRYVGAQDGEGSWQEGEWIPSKYIPVSLGT